ncbi:MAG: peptide MFS transporter, partial [Bacteroidales bacterium]|nr:peptide MFS transporter [Bacteroidales bacterium]
FYALTYVLALVGGLIADKTKKYKGTITAGLIMMSIGYALIAIPTPTPVPNFSLYLSLTLSGLFIIAFGNGLFKGNLQAVVGQLYDNPKYADKRDTGFQIFYMFINVGALFAPLIAVGIRNWWVQYNGFSYNPDLPSLCHRFIKGTITPEASARLTELSTQVSSIAPADLTTFANEYLNIFNTGFHFAFGVAIFAMLISVAVWFTNKNKLPDPAQKAVLSDDIEGEPKIAAMSKDETRQRLYALFAVFAVVVFFWFSFHQNGVTLTFFANDYTNLSMLNIDLGFTTIQGAELFQFFNPFFVVFLTPIIIGLFGWLKAKGIEPSTPKKIAIGMGIAAAGFAVMAIGSLDVPNYSEVIARGGLSDAARVTPFLLIGTYFILTVAELFISPLGLSFVSKVAPPHLQGVMQGAWLGTTAAANLILFVGTIFYESLPLWVAWSIFVVACLLSMSMMLFMLKWLERITK